MQLDDTQTGKPIIINAQPRHEPHLCGGWNNPRYQSLYTLLLPVSSAVRNHEPKLCTRSDGTSIPVFVVKARYIYPRWIEEGTGEELNTVGGVWFETEETSADKSPLRNVANLETDWEEEQEHIRQRCGDWC